MEEKSVVLLGIPIEVGTMVHPIKEIQFGQSFVLKPEAIGVVKSIDVFTPECIDINVEFFIAQGIAHCQNFKGYDFHRYMKRVNSK